MLFFLMCFCLDANEEKEVESKVMMKGGKKGYKEVSSWCGRDPR